MKYFYYIISILWILVRLLGKLESHNLADLCDLKFPSSVNLGSYMPKKPLNTQFMLNATVVNIEGIAIWKIDQHVYQNETTGIHHFALSSHSYHDLITFFSQIETEFYIDLNTSLIQPKFLCGTTTKSIWILYGSRHIDYDNDECSDLNNILLFSPKNLRKIRISQYTNDLPKLLQYYDSYIIETRLKNLNISKLTKIMYIYQKSEHYPTPSLNINLHICYDPSLYINTPKLSYWPDRTKYHSNDVYVDSTQLCNSIIQRGYYNIIHKFLDTTQVIYLNSIRLRKDAHRAIVAEIEGDFASQVGALQTHNLFHHNISMFSSVFGGMPFGLTNFTEFNVSMTEYSPNKNCQLEIFNLSNGHIETMRVFPYEKFHLIQTKSKLYLTVYSHTYPRSDFTYNEYYFKQVSCTLDNANDTGIIKISNNPVLIISKILYYC